MTGNFPIWFDENDFSEREQKELRGCRILILTDTGWKEFVIAENQRPNSGFEAIHRTSTIFR